MPQIRGDLSHPESYLLAKAFELKLCLIADHLKVA